MKIELYHPGDHVKIYFPGGIVKGEVIGVNDITVEATDGKYFSTTKAYLVIVDRHVDEERVYIVTAPFMAREKRK